MTLLCEEDWTGLTRLHQVVERLRTWRPGAEPLIDAVPRAFDLACQGVAPAWTPQQADTERLVRDLLASVPAEWHAVAEDALKATHGTPPAVHPARDGRFLAAHAFANWTAYNGRDLRAWYRSIEAAGMLLRATGDPGQTDLVLRHLADTDVLTTHFSKGH